MRRVSGQAPAPRGVAGSAGQGEVRETHGRGRPGRTGRCGNTTERCGNTAVRRDAPPPTTGRPRCRDSACGRASRGPRVVGHADRVSAVRRQRGATPADGRRRGDGSTTARLRRLVISPGSERQARPAHDARRLVGPPARTLLLYERSSRPADARTVLHRRAVNGFRVRPSGRHRESSRTPGTNPGVSSRLYRAGSPPPRDLGGPARLRTRRERRTRPAWMNGSRSASARPGRTGGTGRDAPSSTSHGCSRPPCAVTAGGRPTRHGLRRPGTDRRQYKDCRHPGQLRYVPIRDAS